MKFHRDTKFNIQMYSSPFGQYGCELQDSRTLTLLLTPLDGNVTSSPPEVQAQTYHATCPYKRFQKSLTQSEWRASLHWLLFPSNSLNLSVHEASETSKIIR